MANNLTTEVFEKAAPLTQEIASYFGDLAASEIVWLDGRIAEAMTAERERCAKLAENWKRPPFVPGMAHNFNYQQGIAESIRRLASDGR